MMDEHTQEGYRRTLALWIAVILILCGCLGGITLLVAVLVTDFSALRQKLLIEHFVAIFGLPSATAAAFVVVTLFRQGEEPIRIKALGFEVQGAAGPIVLWVLCFLAICGGIKLLW
jgi:hypothetical protein